MIDSSALISALRTSRVLAGLPADARESVIGDTVTLVAKHFANTPPESQLKLAFAIAKQRAIDAIRQRTRQQRREQAWIGEGPGGPDPADEAQARETRERLYEAILGSLSEEERVLIHRHFYRGEPVSRVAADLGLEQRQAYTKMARALAVLREALATNERGKAAEPAPGPKRRKRA